MTDGNSEIDALLEAEVDMKKVKVEAGDDVDMKENSSKDVKESKSSRSRSPSRERKRKRSSSRDRKRSRSRDRRRRRSRSRSRDRRRSSRDRKRSRSRSRDRRRRSRSPRRRRSPFSPRRRRSPPRRSPPRSRLPGPERRDVMPFTAKSKPPEGAKMELSAEERDHRTLLIMQIGRMTRPRDLEEFFSSVGNVRDVRIITDSRTGRSKGIGYVEFWEEESVSLGLALNGQKLQGAPLLIQRTCAERNRAAAGATAAGLGFAPTTKGPAVLFIENVHPLITESMLRDVFDTFGRLEKITIEKDASGEPSGTATILFKSAEDAVKARDNLNNLDLAGKSIKITLKDGAEAEKSLDKLGDDSGGLVSGNGNRAQIMNKLAQGRPAVAAEERDPSIPSIATECFMLSNMFDPNQESAPNWDQDVREDVIEECSKHGGALHVYVDRGSKQGNVYVKCPSVSVSHKSVSSLHGRWFSGKVITANYVPVDSYHDLFPDAMSARVVLIPRPQPAGAPIAGESPWPPTQPSATSVQGFGYY